MSVVSEQKAGFDPRQVRDPHTGEWIDTPGLLDVGSWFWADDEERVGIEAPDDAQAAGVQPGTQAAAAARAYTTGSYRDLNQRLMNEEPLTPAQEAIAGSLRGAMKDLPSRPTVFRGVHVGPEGRTEEDTRRMTADWAQENFPIGSTVELRGLQSTSFDVNPALDASLGRYKPGVIFEIRARNGAYLGTVSEFDDEAELLLDSGNFVVRRVLRDVKFARDIDTVVRRTVVQLVQV